MIQSLKILITGAPGFIGKHLLDKLIKTSYEIACVSLSYDRAFIEKYGKEVRLFEGNLCDKEFIISSVREFSPDYVFHLAGSKSRTNLVKEFKSSIAVNYLGTLNLFEGLLEVQNLKLVTIMGTIEEYGRTNSPFREDSLELPNSAYGLSKLSATKLALIFNRQFNLPVTVFRPSIAYGPYQGEEMFIPALIKTLLKQGLFKMTEGNQLRDFIFVEDLIDALIKCIDCMGIVGEVLNIASGTSIKLKEVALQISQLTKGSKYLKIGELPYRDSEIMDYAIDISKAASVLNWKPQTSLQKGIEETVSFYTNSLLDEA